MDINEVEDYPLLTEAEEQQLECSRKPFYGLFGDSLKLRILERLMADPGNCFSPKDLIPFVNQGNKLVNSWSIEVILKRMVEEGLLEICPDCKAYRVNFKSKRWVALTLLAFAGNDDFSDRKEEDLGDCKDEKYPSSMDRAMEVYLSGHKCILMPFCIDGSSEFKEE
jgi:hypothetical protein